MIQPSPYLVTALKKGWRNIDGNAHPEDHAEATIESLRQHGFEIVRRPTARAPTMRPIPVKAARDIAHRYGYHQVIVIGRHVGKDGGEHMTTYGTTKQHCSIIARAGEFLKTKVMGWNTPSKETE